MSSEVRCTFIDIEQALVCSNDVNRISRSCSRQHTKHIHRIADHRKVVFIFDLVLFLLFNALMVTRFILVPRKMLASLHHQSKDFFTVRTGCQCSDTELCIRLRQRGYRTLVSKSTRSLFLDLLRYCLYRGRLSVLHVLPSRASQCDRRCPGLDLSNYPLLVVGTLAWHHLACPTEWSQLEHLCWRSLVARRCVGRLVPHVCVVHATADDWRSTITSYSARMFVSVGPAGKLSRWFSAHTTSESNRI